MPLPVEGLGLNSVTKAVMAIVTGIRNSITSERTLTTLNVAKAKVRECPIVKAVTRIRIFFQSLATKPHRAPIQIGYDQNPGCPEYAVILV